MKTSRSRQRTGQAAVELALILPLLLLVMAGLLDIAGVVASAARQGARYGATAPTEDGQSGHVDTIRDRVIEEAAGSGVTITRANIAITYKDENADGTLGNSGDAIVVQVTYQFTPVLGSFIKLNTIKIGNSCTMAIF